MAQLSSNGNPTMLKKIIFVIAVLLCPLLAFADGVEVIKVKGEVKSAGKLLKKGAKLNEGDLIEVTGKKSFVQLRFEDGSQVLQKEGTLTLKKVAKGKTLLSLLKGVIFVYKNPDAESKLNVKTKTASLAVRGTKFYVEETDKTYLCVCEGTVAARNKFGTVDVTAGEDLYAPTRQTLEKKDANKMMMKMALEGFDLMGLPVKK